MSEFNNSDIPIICGECSPDEIILGRDSMVRHILSHHAGYTSDDANYYADAWMREAFERVEQEAVDYAYQMNRRK